MRSNTKTNRVQILAGCTQPGEDTIRPVSAGLNGRDRNIPLRAREEDADKPVLLGLYDDPVAVLRMMYPLARTKLHSASDQEIRG